MVERGRLFVGTSGFAYPGWAPRFYAPGSAGRGLLSSYAARLPAVELNNTFYRRPSPGVVARWLRETPDVFRFCVKAQRGSAWRAWTGPDAASAVAWLSEALGAFGARLGCVLMTTSATMSRDDEALARLLAAWPVAMPLALELPHPSWAADAVHALIDGAGVALVASDVDDRPEPDLRRIGSFLYLRLRRSAYAAADIERWAWRLEPFLTDGLDAFVFFRHDEDGQMALWAEALRAEALRAATRATMAAKDGVRWHRYTIKAAPTTRSWREHRE